jgi:hypothetical protein
MLAPLEVDTANAQYFFSAETVEATLDLIAQQGCKRVLCLGAPRIHEEIVLRSQQHGGSGSSQTRRGSDGGSGGGGGGDGDGGGGASGGGATAISTSYLLDMDGRFGWFYGPNNYCALGNFNIDCLFKEYVPNLYCFLQ